ncbi:MAG: outer membrane lipoprotein-sorting protein [bacterium]|nr:outer membrane lipoprotein-sorting protein [bacterium]
MRILSAVLLISACTGPVLALTPEEILKKVDDNQVFQTIQYSGTMVIQKGNRRKPLEKTFFAAARGKDTFYMEFTNPGDRGTKYLKLNNELWIKGTYAERADKISGHTLRESMMGSDYSYEDAMENEKLTDQYDVILLGTEKWEGKRDCYKLELTAKVKEVSYYRQVIWVDQERFLGLKVQLFALSKKLLKEMTVLDIKEIKGRMFPVEIKMENKQHRNSYTLFRTKDVQLDEPLSDSFFSKQQLEK